MQMTPENDNLAVWCIRMKSEGTSLVANGTFVNDTGWTATSGDWTFADGVAKYIYVDDVAGDLDYTVAAVSAVPYVLEYEITSITGTGFTMTVIGGGTSIIAATTAALPITVGQHRVILQGVATKTLLRFHAGGFGASDVLHLDNVKLRKLEETTYLATETLDLTADGNTWDGQVLEFNDRISDVSSFIDTDSSGTIGGVASYQFTIARNSANTRFDGYFEEFYPTFLGGTLTAMDCEIGVVWNTATTDTEITWLLRGRIVDYRCTPRKMTLTVLQSTEIDAREIPYYSVQKDFDNKVSYYTDAPDDNYGVPIPIVYGDFKGSDIGERLIGQYRLTPVLMVDRTTSTFIFASHKVFSTFDDVYSYSTVHKYIDSLKVYEQIKTVDAGHTTEQNTDIKYSIIMQNTATVQLIGNLTLPLKTLSLDSGVTSITNILNNDTDDYVTLAGGATTKLALTLGGTGSTSEVGALSSVGLNLRINFRASSDDANNRTYTISFTNNTQNPAAAGGTTQHVHTTGASFATQEHLFGADTTGKRDTTLPWTIEEVCGLDYWLRNDDAAAGGSDDIRVSQVYLDIRNIIISGFSIEYDSRDQGKWLRPYMIERLL